MRPPKKVLIYHPIASDAHLFRYAMAIRLHWNVRVAKNASDLRKSSADVTVHWKGLMVILSCYGNGISRRLPANATNIDLFEAVRVAAARKRGPKQEGRLA